MPSHSEGPGIWLSVWRFLLTHYLYERAAEVLARLRGCAGSPEPSLLAYAISTKFAWRGPNDVSNYRVIKDQVAEFLFSRFKSEWSADINRMNVRNGNGRNKLRTYRQYKQEFKSEAYLKCSMSRVHRSTYAKFRCRVAPIRIETGRHVSLSPPSRFAHFPVRPECKFITISSIKY